MRRATMVDLVRVRVRVRARVRVRVRARVSVRIRARVRVGVRVRVRARVRARARARVRVRVRARMVDQRAARPACLSRVTCWREAHSCCARAMHAASSATGLHVSPSRWTPG